MEAPTGTILTIGHSTHTLEAFVGLLRRHEGDCVVDVRSTPYSRFNPQFNREPLARRLAECGIEYTFFGDALGGRSDDPACFENGRIRYDRLAATALFRQGLDRVVQGILSRRAVLMCAEKEPLECHRTLLVAHSLDARGILVEHILARGGLETHAATMDRLLGMHGDLLEGDLLRTRQERIDEAIERQAKRFAFQHRTRRDATSRAADLGDRS